MILLIISTIRSFCFSQAAKQARIYLGMGAQLPGTQSNYCPKVRQWQPCWQAHKSGHLQRGHKSFGGPLQCLGWFRPRFLIHRSGPSTKSRERGAKSTPKHINHSVSSHLWASTPQPSPGEDQRPPFHPCCDTQSISVRYQ